MNCLFCQQQTRISYDGPLNQIVRYRCKPCCAVFIYNSELKDLVQWRFTCGDWSVNFCPRHNPPALYVSENSIQVIKLPFMSHNINPYNFLKKLPTLLTFS